MTASLAPPAAKLTCCGGVRSPVIWRVLLAALYAIAFGALLALENFNPEMSDMPLLAVWLAAPVVGFLVGRWWVLLAIAGALVGRTIGWDPGENDGTPAFWWPFALTMAVLLGLPLLFGVALSQAWQDRRRRAQLSDSASPH
jgi:hypothetical protein